MNIQEEWEDLRMEVQSFLRAQEVSRQVHSYLVQESAAHILVPENSRTALCQPGRVCLKL